VANLPPSREELLYLYNLHIEEVRFQTKFNWDRTQYFLILNVGIVGAAASLWKSDAALPALFLLAGLFIAGGLMCPLSVAAIRQGHKYYRKAVLQKARIELLLNLIDVDSGTLYVAPFDLTTSSTSGQASVASDLAHPEAYMSRQIIRRGQVNWFIQLFLYALCKFQ
jgi:hypothetical protein